MSTRLKKWLPIGLCCLPGIAIAAFVGASVLLGGASVGAGLGSPLRLGLLALALLACPLGMGVMTWLNKRNAPEGLTNNVACCAPGEQMAMASKQVQATSSAERLAQLVARRETLERQLAVKTGER